MATGLESLQARTGIAAVRPTAVSLGEVRRADTVQKLIKLLPRPMSKKNRKLIVSKLKTFQAKISAEKLLAAESAKDESADSKMPENDQPVDNV